METEKILIVDDAKINRTLAKMALEEKGYTIYECDNGLDAIGIAKEIQPDLILLDIIMPKMNGLEACRRIKQGSTTANIPIILISAIEEFPIKKEGYTVGADDYIVKPFKIEDLLLRAEIILKVRREKSKLIKQQAEMNDMHQSLIKNQAHIIEKEKEHLLHQVYVALHHEIRNPLTSILIGAQVLGAKFEESTSEQKIISEIEHCAKRIRDIMDSLGNMKNIIVDDYVMGTQMVNLHGSSQFTRTQEDADSTVESN